MKRIREILRCAQNDRVGAWVTGTAAKVEAGLMRGREERARGVSLYFKNILEWRMSITRRQKRGSA